MGLVAPAPAGNRVSILKAQEAKASFISALQQSPGMLKAGHSPGGVIVSVTVVVIVISAHISVSNKIFYPPVQPFVSR